MASRPGIKFWLAVAIAGGVLAAQKFGKQREEAPGETPGTAPAAAARASKLPYALDTTRGAWPPLDETTPADPAAANPNAVNYYVVLDGSGSMRKTQCSGNTNKIEAAVHALNDFVAAAPREHQLGLAVFDAQGLSERVPLGGGNAAAMVESLAHVQADGSTPLHSAISLGYEKLTRQARRQMGYGEYHLVVVTDGHPDPASEDPRDVVNRILFESPVLLHTVGFCIGEDHVLNQPGRVFYAAADSPAQLREGLEAVLAESPTFDISRFGP
jgi:Ca-activated chloride channel homolog